MKFPHTNKNLHVCVYHKEHVDKGKEIYGEGRVENQLKKRIESCAECRMLVDLCIFVGIDLSDYRNKRVVRKSTGEVLQDAVDVKESDTLLELDNHKVPLTDRDGKVIGVQNRLVYTEAYEIDLDAFFDLKGKRAVDLL